MAQTIITKVGTPSIGTLGPKPPYSPIQIAASIGAMDAVYVNSAGKIDKATATTGCVGFAPAAALVAQREALSPYDDFETEYGSGMTPGSLIYLGPTAGAIYTGTAPASGFISPVGIVLSAVRVRLFGNFRGATA